MKLKLGYVFLPVAIASLYGGCAGDGPYVWFTTDRDGRTEIYRMRTNGSDPTNLTETTGFDESGPSVTADGKVIVYRRWINTGGPAGNDDDDTPLTGGVSDIFSMDANGNNQTNLTNTGGVSEYTPSIRKDGTLIAYRRDGSIWTMNPDGSNQINRSLGVADSSPSFSPDGTKIAFRRSGNIWTINATGSSNLTQLTSSGDDNAPTWRPDGLKIVFERYNGFDDDIWHMDSDGTNEELVYDSDDDDDDPVYSPNGSYIFYEEDSPKEIIRINADGSDRTNITNHAAEDQDATTVGGR